MRALLDVSTLLALVDPNHEHHGRARRWFYEECDDGWASCAITENGFVRILSQPIYPGGTSTSRAIDALDDTCQAGDHEYWPCDVSLRDASVIHRGSVLSHKQVTDIYLLALATAHGGRFVTFDKGVALQAVPRAMRDNLVAL